MSVSAQPPVGLDLVIDFVNTRDIDAGTDELASPEQLKAWLAARGLLQSDLVGPDDADLHRVISLREALRALMLANNGEERDPRAGPELEIVARRGKLGVHFASDGSARLASAQDGVDGVLARLLIPVVGAQGDGTWRRVKACRADACQWAFYDGSRNRSGVWCDMAVCGNRTKVRAYRERAPG